MIPLCLLWKKKKRRKKKEEEEEEEEDAAAKRAKTSRKRASEIRVSNRSSTTSGGLKSTIENAESLSPVDLFSSYAKIFS